MACQFISVLLIELPVSYHANSGESGEDLPTGLTAHQTALEFNMMEGDVGVLSLREEKSRTLLTLDPHRRSNDQRSKRSKVGQ